MDVRIAPSRVAGRVLAPPSKSYTHRALLAAGYGTGGVVRRALLSDDTRATARAVRALGGAVEFRDDGAGRDDGEDRNGGHARDGGHDRDGGHARDDGDRRGRADGRDGRPGADDGATGEGTPTGTATAVVEGFDGRPATPGDVLDCANSGTTMRLATAAAGLCPGLAVLTGDRSLRDRPQGPLLDAVAALGGRAESTRDNGQAPLVVGDGMTGGRVAVPGDVSSQFVTALLMAGAVTGDGVVVDLTTPLKSAPYVAITREVLAEFGVGTRRSEGEGDGGDTYAVAGGQRYRAGSGTDRPTDADGPVDVGDADADRPTDAADADADAPAGPRDADAGGPVDGGGEAGDRDADADGRGEYVVPGDFSSASYPLAAGAVAGARDPGSGGGGSGGDGSAEGDTADGDGADATGGEGGDAGADDAGDADDGDGDDDGAVVVGNLRPGPQGDAAFLDVLDRMGAAVEFDREAATVTVGRRPLTGVEVSVADTPDLLPTIAVVGAVADGTTRIVDCEHVRYKETDRVAAMAAELGRMGAAVEQGPDELVVRGGDSGLHGARVDGRGDHRVVMALSVAALAAAGPTTVAGAEHVSVSYPGFFDALTDLGAHVELREGGERR